MTPRGLEAFQVFGKTIRVQHKAKDANIPARPQAIRILVDWRHLGRMG
jgi:hypothetical protein